jgi:prepilin-type processing-associated H-X9-DG protein
MQCSNNLKQIALALAAYEDNHGFYPPSRVGCDEGGPCSHDYERVATSGFVAILPQLDLQTTYNMFDFDSGGPWWINSRGQGWLPRHREAIAQRPAVFVCPSDSAEPWCKKNIGGFDYSSTPVGTGSFALVSGSIGAANGALATIKYNNNGVFFYRSCMPRSDLTDGLSKTMFVGEVVDGHTNDSFNVWSRGGRETSCQRSTSNPVNTWPAEPIAMTLNGITVNGAFASRHPGGANFGFGDGHVRFIEENIAMHVYQALSTRSNNEVVEEP